jgi:hypothetical protein
MNMVRGETIIQDVEGLSFELRRSLRDLRHQFPVVEAAIKVAHFLLMHFNCRSWLTVFCPSSTT